MRRILDEEEKELIRTTPELQRLTYVNDIAELFFNALEKYDIETYVNRFMQTSIMAAFDYSLSEYHWRGAAYLADEAEGEMDMASMPSASDKQLSQIKGWQEILYWTAFIYQHWHFTTTEPSSVINKKAPAGRIFDTYYIFHTYDPDDAIRELGAFDDFENETEMI